MISTLLGRLLLTAKPISISVPRSPGPQVTPFLFQSIGGYFNLGPFFSRMHFWFCNINFKIFMHSKVFKSNSIWESPGPQVTPFLISVDFNLGLFIHWSFYISDLGTFIVFKTWISVKKLVKSLEALPCILYNFLSNFWGCCKIHHRIYKKLNLQHIR